MALNEKFPETSDSTKPLIMAILPEVSTCRQKIFMLDAIERAGTSLILTFDDYFGKFTMSR